MTLKQSTLRALQDMFGEDASPTEIQQKAIPPALKGNNVIGQARTGSGKTLAFSIPIIEEMQFKRVPEAIILVPTRELCKQVANVFQELAKYTKDVRIVQIYGGVSLNPQIDKLANGANVVVATPGRLIDLYERRKISFKEVSYVVLDEADRMLDMGFIPDVQYILSKIHGDPRFLLFSATILEEIKRLSDQFTKGKYIDIDVSEDSMTVGNTQQYYYLIKHFKDKYYDFVRILQRERPQKTLVFTNTKKTADWLTNRLQNYRGLNFRIGLLSGNMSQAARERVTKKFKEKKINFLVATDVAARGLDIPNVTHVFNYDVPQYEENYVHRIGRTSRMGKKGIAITLCLEDEYKYLCRIEGFIEKSINRKPLPKRRSRKKGERKWRPKRYSKKKSSKKKLGKTKYEKRGGEDFVNPFF